jgi:hypothetical protein
MNFWELQGAAMSPKASHYTQVTPISPLRYTHLFKNYEKKGFGTYKPLNLLKFRANL